MTQVCFVGDPEINLRYELLSRETARDALQTYDLGTPFHNSIGVETVSLGAAVALTNDLNWYIVRFVADVLVYDPSVSESEWLSRDLATAIRDDDVAHEESGRFLKIYGLEGDHGGTGGDGGSSPEADREIASEGEEVEESPITTGPSGGSEEGSAIDSGPRIGAEEPPRLVEPMYVTRTGPTVPEYDLRDVENTLVVRVTEDEFGA
ncbi:MAG: DUF5804 family protein [Haloarculaceae archaeon]